MTEPRPSYMTKYLGHMRWYGPQRIVKFFAPHYVNEVIEDGDGPGFWMGIAWYDPMNERSLYLPRPLNIVYRITRGLIEWLYWPFYLQRFYALKYNILRRCIEGRCVDPTTDESMDPQYSKNALKQICLEMQGLSYKALQELHRKWVGYQ